MVVPPLLVFPGMPHLAQDLAVMRDRLGQEVVELVERAVGRGVPAYDWLASYGALAQLAGRRAHLDELLAVWPSRSRAEAEAALLRPGEPRPPPPRPRQSQPIPPLEVIEREAINRALTKTGGNVTRAAAALRISRSTLQRKMDAIPPEERSPAVRAALARRKGGDNETGD